MARLGRSLWVAPIVIGTVLGGVSWAADTRPSGGDQPYPAQSAGPQDQGGNNATSVGRDFGGPPPQIAPPPAALNAPAVPQVQTDFPADTVHDWVVASAIAAHSRAMFRRAENELNLSVRDVQLNFEQSQEFQQAKAKEKQAYDAYTSERQKALQSIVNEPKYKAAMDLRDEVGDQIAHLRAYAGKDRDIPREQLLTLASLKLQYASEAHSMESAALDKDQSLKDARQKMVEAASRVAQLRTEFDQSIRNNPQILQARRNLEDARVALITNQAYLSAAATAGYLATDYAYYRHRADYLQSYDRYGWDFWGPAGYRY